MIAVTHRGGRDALPVIARSGLSRRQGDDGGSGGHLLENCRGHLAACPGQQAAGDDHRVHERLDHQRPTKFLGDHHGLGRSAAAAPDRLRQGGAQDAEFLGESAPDVGLPTGAGLGRSTALVEVVARGEELVEAVAQEGLFLAECEIHGLQPQGRFGEDVALNLVAAGVN